MSAVVDPSYKVLKHNEIIALNALSQKITGLGNLWTIHLEQNHRYILQKLSNGLGIVFDKRSESLVYIYETSQRQHLSLPLWLKTKSMNTPKMIYGSGDFKIFDTPFLYLLLYKRLVIARDQYRNDLIEITKDFERDKSKTAATA